MARRSRTRAELKGLPRPQAGKREERSTAHRARRAPFSASCGPGLPTGGRPREVGKVMEDLTLGCVLDGPVRTVGAAYHVGCRGGVLVRVVQGCVARLLRRSVS